jgi:hypothetical protein
MSDDEEGTWTTNGNNQGIKFKDVEEDEVYEPTDDFNQKIIEIFSWTHNDSVYILEKMKNEERPYSPRRKAQYGQTIFII